ncbi:hypothetical protein TSUD_61450, partial [Trifolium subterraneum]
KAEAFVCAAVPLWCRSNSTKSSLPTDNSISDAKIGQGFKGHAMLAPFTPGWQTTDLNPLIIEKSEVYFHAMFL